MDGALVPLVHGTWAEVKTLVVGVVGEPVRQGEEGVGHSGELSYFSRRLEAEAFSGPAWVEIQRRRAENAGQVVAVMAGAEGEQRFVGFQGPRAVRLLDFPRAAERLSQMAETPGGEGQAIARSCLEQRWQPLKQEGPAAWLAELRGLQDQHPDQTVLAENLADLEKRAGHRQYPQYQARGGPIGSEMVERATR